MTRSHPRRRRAGRANEGRRRRRGRREIIAPAGLEEAMPAHAPVNRGLAVMVARAYRWRKLLESGRYATIRALAADLGVDNSYVARIMRLTLLAPDLVEAILEGTEPDGLSLEKLYRLPVERGEQRRALGAASAARRPTGPGELVPRPRPAVPPTVLPTLPSRTAEGPQS